MPTHISPYAHTHTHTHINYLFIKILPFWAASFATNSAYSNGELLVHVIKVKIFNFILFRAVLKKFNSVSVYLFCVFPFLHTRYLSLKSTITGTVGYSPTLVYHTTSEDVLWLWHLQAVITRDLSSVIVIICWKGKKSITVLPLLRKITPVTVIIIILYEFLMQYSCYFLFLVSIVRNFF